MGLSFRKSITVMPGVKINLSKSGVGLSVGTKGVHASINSSGRVGGSIGLPGTGISYRKSTNVKKIAEAVTGNKTSSKKTASSSKSSAKPKAAALPAEEPQIVEKKTPAKKNDVISVDAIYAVSDPYVDWGAIQNNNPPKDLPNVPYFKLMAEKVMSGDIDAYLQVIEDINPFNDLLEYGAGFECGSDNPMKMHILFEPHFDKLKGASKDLLNDYVGAVAIRSARDMFALLPVWQVIITAQDEGKDILNVTFVRSSFEQLDFENIDASDTIEKFGGKIEL